MTEQELQEIEARAEEHNDSEEFFDHACEDIPALVAEVRRLRAGLERIVSYVGGDRDEPGFTAAGIAEDTLAGVEQSQLDP